MPSEIAAIAVAALALAAGAALAALHRRGRRRLAAARAAVFAATYDLFESYRVTQDGIDFPSLRGRYRGHDFHLDLVTDTLTFRKLPVLWLRVSLVAALPGTGTLDILVRSQNVEFYSPSADLPHRIEPRPGWPADAMVKTDDIARAPDVAVIDRHIAMFETPQVKELLITPKGVRIVYLLDQARRAEYLVLRQAEFDHASLAPALLRDLMDRTILLHADLRSTRDET